MADLVERAVDLVEPIKPKLRGWLHAGMVPASLAAGVVLICLAGTPQAVLACTVYSVTAWLLFGTSAVYHLGTWDRSARPFCAASTTPTALTAAAFTAHCIAILLAAHY